MWQKVENLDTLDPLSIVVTKTFNGEINFYSRQNADLSTTSLPHTPHTRYEYGLPASRIVMAFSIFSIVSETKQLVYLV